MSKVVKKSSKKSTEVEVAPVEVAPVEVAPVVTLSSRFEALVSLKTEQIVELKREIAELKKMQKDHEQSIKEALKKQKKKKERDPNAPPRKPSGFAAEVQVSNDMYKFLSQYGVKNGDLITRPQVTKYITTYISEKNLQNPEIKKEFIPDAVLRELLGPVVHPRDKNTEGSPQVYGYFNLQKYLSSHFPKKA